MPTSTASPPNPRFPSLKPVVSLPPVTLPHKRTSGSVAMDDYLEQILHLIEAKGYARAVDISKNLGISQASVTNMLRRLDAEGLVLHEKYRGTVLTEEGHRIARAIIERHGAAQEAEKRPIRGAPSNRQALHGRGGQRRAAPQGSGAGPELDGRPQRPS